MCVGLKWWDQEVWSNRKERSRNLGTQVPSSFRSHLCLRFLSGPAGCSVQVAAYLPLGSRGKYSKSKRTLFFFLDPRAMIYWHYVSCLEQNDVVLLRSHLLHQSETEVEAHAGPPIPVIQAAAFFTAHIMQQSCLDRPRIHRLSLHLSLGFVCGVFVSCWSIMYSDFMVYFIRLLLHICICKSASALHTIPCQPNILFSWCLSGMNIWLCFAGHTPNPFSCSLIFPGDGSPYFLIHFTHFPGLFWRFGLEYFFLCTVAVCKYIHSCVLGGEG